MSAPVTDGRLSLGIPGSSLTRKNTPGFKDEVPSMRNIPNVENLSDNGSVFKSPYKIKIKDDTTESDLVGDLPKNGFLPVI